MNGSYFGASYEFDSMSIFVLREMLRTNSQTHSFDTLQ